MKNISVKRLIPHVAAIVIFVAITLVYFNPVLSGKKLQQPDIDRHKGMSKEVVDFRERTGEEALWTNSMFGGMPAYQISVKYKNNLMAYVDDIFQLGLPHPAGLVFLYFLGFYILLLVLRVNPWISIAGAIAFAFSSYFFIILEAGHNSKAHAIGYMAPVLAGIILTYRGRLISGSIMTAFFLALEIRAGHPQITYYLLLMVIIYGIVVLIDAVRNKWLPRFLKASAFLIVAAILGTLTHTTSLWATYEYGKYTIRGPSELTSNQENKTSGLDKDYATAWSYGVTETMSLLIPNIKGGASVPFAENQSALDKVDPQMRRSLAGWGQYFGTQPFTSGPVYVGAITIFLFVLGLFFLTGRLKWFLVIATILSILLAWGKNFMFLTDFFLEYFPGYNKFRAVSMTLVIAELAIPVLAFLSLYQLFMKPDEVTVHKKKFFYAFGIAGGLSLLVFFFPSIFGGYITAEETRQFNEYRAQGASAQIDSYIANLEAARAYLVSSDALRSFIYILLTAATIWFYSKGKISKPLFILLITVFILADMWGVSKRYLNDDNFVRSQAVEVPYEKSQADRQILQDDDPNFRVLNLAANTFNDASTSYYHKSVGGYHGAKLRRYQELIEHHIQPRNMAVLNMLNTKYIIRAGENNREQAIQNPGALGNAWFVKDYRIVENADQEIDALNDFQPAQTAILDDRFSEYVEDFQPAHDASAFIRLEEYEPNRLVYSYQSDKPQMAVFSEIYYPRGWNAYIDGEWHPHFRVNYVLRAMIVPGGEHTIEFKFEPQVYYTGETISLISSILLLLIVAGYTVGRATGKIKEGTPETQK